MTVPSRSTARDAPGRLARVAAATALAVALLGTPTTLAAQTDEPGDEELELGNGEFTHEDHVTLGCTDCHDSRETHGALGFRIPEGCASCHHESADRAECAACHVEADLRDRDLPRPTSMRVATGSGRDRVSRDLPFEHGEHAGIACVECHTDPRTRSAAATACLDCHREHHEPDRACVACHREAPADAHPARIVHRTCTGAGCHGEAEVAASGWATSGWTRPVCLSCHQDQVDHEVGRECADCHAVPERRSSGSTRMGARP